jgi:anti-anti-sigma factor
MDERGVRSPLPRVVDVPPLGIEIDRSRNGSAVVTLRGRLDARTAALLEDRLRGALVPGRPRIVVLDLNAVTALTEAGLDVLLELHARVTAAGGRVELLDPSPAVVLLLHAAVHA